MDNPIEARIAELGLALPDAPAPAANYVPFVRSGDTLYVSGQISSGADGLILGKLGEDMAVEAGAAAAQACALSLLAQVRAACEGDLGRLKRVVKLTGFVNSTPDFTDQPKVINGASDLMVEVLGEAGRHARSAVSAASLPLGAYSIVAAGSAPLIVNRPDLWWVQGDSGNRSSIGGWLRVFGRNLVLGATDGATQRLEARAAADAIAAAANRGDFETVQKLAAAQNDVTPVARAKPTLTLRSALTNAALPPIPAMNSSSGKNASRTAHSPTAKRSCCNMSGGRPPAIPHISFCGSILPLDPAEVTICQPGCSASNRRSAAISPRSLGTPQTINSLANVLAETNMRDRKRTNADI